MTAHQARIPPSRRTAGYRPVATQTQAADGTKLPPSSALLFTPRASEELDDAPGMEMLVDPLGDSQMSATLHDTDLTNIARSSSRRSSSTPMGPSFPHILRAVSAHQEALATTDAHVKDKLTAAGSEAHTREELVKRYGKRKADKIIAGRMAVEDGKIYDMSLLRACYESNKKGIWRGAIMLLLGCEFSHLSMPGPPNSRLSLVSDVHPSHHSSHYRRRGCSACACKWR